MGAAGVGKADSLDSAFAGASCDPRRAIITLVYLREHTTYTNLAAGFPISKGTAHTYAQSVTRSDFSPRRHRPRHIPCPGHAPHTT
ncbi:transposase family protein [Streptomyces sp. NPDC047981]|uniref:transposase family protein n=1 Tax=Streptomyces sp. NPDC047981 TaxID=3154610 RepID=UPI0034426E09